MAGNLVDPALGLVPVRLATQYDVSIPEGVFKGIIPSGLTKGQVAQLE